MGVAPTGNFATLRIAKTGRGEGGECKDAVQWNQGRARQIVLSNTDLWVQIACGCGDADDCDHTRRDAAFKAAVGGGVSGGIPFASQPAMTRLENILPVENLSRIGCGFVDHFMDSYGKKAGVDSF